MTSAKRPARRRLVATSASMAPSSSSKRFPLVQAVHGLARKALPRVWVDRVRSLEHQLLPSDHPQLSSQVVRRPHLFGRLPDVRGRVQGLSFDFVALNVLGFACYTVANTVLKASAVVRQEYARRHDGGFPSVQWSDVAFGVHAIVVTTVTLMQTRLYKVRRASRLATKLIRSRAMEAKGSRSGTASRSACWSRPSSSPPSSPPSTRPEAGTRT